MLAGQFFSLEKPRGPGLPRGENYGKHVTAAFFSCFFLREELAANRVSEPFPKQGDRSDGGFKGQAPFSLPTRSCVGVAHAPLVRCGVIAHARHLLAHSPCIAPHACTPHM
jgi:hypothetical protein